jgi:hypothetical protein
LKVVEHGEGFALGYACVASCTGGLPFTSTIYSPSSILSTAAIYLRLWWQISSARTLGRTDSICFRAAPFLCPQYFSTDAPRLFNCFCSFFSTMNLFLAISVIVVSVRYPRYDVSSLPYGHRTLRSRRFDAWFGFLFVFTLSSHCLTLQRFRSSGQTPEQC